MGAQQSALAGFPIGARNGVGELPVRESRLRTPPSPPPTPPCHPKGVNLPVGTANLVSKWLKKREESRPTIEGCARNGSPRRRVSETLVGDDSAARRHECGLMTPAGSKTPVRRHSAEAILMSYAPRQPSDVLRIPGAALLFEAFLDSTFFQLLPGDSAVNVVAPMVLGDDMAMHALISLSASYMRGTLPDADFRARYHYGLAVRALRDRVESSVQGRNPDTAAMLLTVLLFCNFELNYGDTSKAFSVHRSGARQLIRLYTQDVRRNSDWTFMSFLLEYFGYMSTVSYVMSLSKDVPGVSLDGRVLMPALHSLEELRMRFGFAFRLSYPVLLEAPRAVELLVSDDDNIYAKPSEPADGREQAKKEKRDSAISIEATVNGSVKGADEADMNLLACQMLHQACLLNIHIVAHGARPPDAALHEKIDPIVDEFYRIVEQFRMGGVVSATIMWACVIVGSCTRKLEQRRTFKAMIRNSGFKPAFITTVIKVMEHIWSGEDSHAYGPFGIKRVIALRNLNVDLRALRPD